MLLIQLYETKAAKDAPGSKYYPFHRTTEGKQNINNQHSGGKNYSKRRLELIFDS